MVQSFLRRGLGTPPFLALVVALLTLAPSGPRAEDLPPLRGEQPPFFNADFLISLDTQQRPMLGVSVTVPYPELEWIRVSNAPGDGRLAAGVELTVAFESKPSVRLYGDTWERRLVVPSFSTSRSPTAVVLEKRTFAVPPGRYTVRVTIRDINSGSQSAASQRIDVPDYSHIPVGFTDLEMGAFDTTGVFTANSTRRYGLDVTRMAARAAMFDKRAGNWPRHYTLQYRIRDDTGTDLVNGDQEVNLSHSGDSVVVRPSQSDLFLGEYVFEVELAEGKSHWRVERSFEVDESGPPRGKEFERMLEPLSFIASPEEIERLRSLPADQQSAGWEAFWRRRDPSPDTPRNEAMIEFFRRVRYAEHRFQGFGPGWRSDMGRIYIKFGPPDQIENRPASTENPQLEIWYYNQPYRRFVFGDREGFGRFVLLNPGVE